LVATTDRRVRIGFSEEGLFNGSTKQNIVDHANIKKKIIPGRKNSKQNTLRQEQACM
jgi:hypothetical protein